jgi:hypothetical protein
LNFDHLSNLPDEISGYVVSVEQVPNGQRITIKPDMKFGDRRYIGHSMEVVPLGTPIKPGYNVTFLPGVAPKRKQARAYRIQIVRTGPNRAIADEAG